MFTNGPWLLYTRDTTANIWFQLDAAGTLTVTINGTTFSKAISADPWTGFIAVTGLTANTLYTYTLSLDGVAVAGSWEFRTMPTEGSPGVFRVTLESDNHIAAGWTSDQEVLQEAMYQKLLDRMNTLPPAPHLSIACGDTEISGSTVLATRRTDHTQIRKLGGSAGARAQWRGNTPLCHVWDDWDYLSNNSAGQEFTAADRLVAETVWREFFDGAPATVEANAIYHTFKIADVVFLMLDNRTYREGTLGTQNPAEVNPWNHLDTNNVWGPTQLAWIKSTLTANKDAPFKVIVNGCNMMDPVSGGPSGAARRDSIGLYHRRERNELFKFLKDNPAEASGLLFMKGDDHRNMCHHERFFAPPEAITAASAIPDLAIEKQEYASITQIAGGMLRNVGALDRGWREHPGEKFRFTADAGAVVVVDIDTVSNQKTMKLSWFDFDSGSFVYSCHCVNDEWYFPQTTHRSILTGGGTEVAHTPDAAPSDTWTPDPEP